MREINAEQHQRRMQAAAKQRRLQVGISDARVVEHRREGFQHEINDHADRKRLRVSPTGPDEEAEEVSRQERTEEYKHPVSFTMVRTRRTGKNTGEKKSPARGDSFLIHGGEGGIRTHGTI